MKLVELYRDLFLIVLDNRKNKRTYMRNRVAVIVGGSAGGLELNSLSSCEYCTHIYDGFHMNANFFPDLQEPRRSPSVLSMNIGQLAPGDESGLLVVGGCVGPGKHLDSIRLLTKTAKKEENKWAWFMCSGKLLQGLSCASSCRFEDGSCFIAGGYNGHDCLSGAYLIKPQPDDQISLLHMNFLPTRCKNAAALAVKSDQNSKIALIFGGWDEKRTLCSIFEYSIFQNEQECILKGVMSTPLEGHTVTKLPGNRQSQAVICGGFDGINVVNTIYIFQVDSMKMSMCEHAKLKIPRENHVAFCVDEDRRDFLVVAGGWDGKKALRSCEVFEIFGEKPILRRIDDHKLELNVARNRPAMAFVDCIL